MSTTQLQSIFQTHGGIEGSDSLKIIRFLEDGGMVDLSKLDQAYERAKYMATEQSSALKALLMKMSRFPKLIISKLEE